MEQHNFINFPEMDFLEYSFFNLSDKSHKNKNNHQIYPVNNTFFSFAFLLQLTASVLDLSAVAISHTREAGRR